MPFSEQASVRAGDGDDAASSTQLVLLTLSPSDDVSIKGELGIAGTNTVSYPVDDLAVKGRAALALIDGDPGSGFTQDVTDDPTTQLDTKTLTYEEPAPAASPPLEAAVVLRDGTTSNIVRMSVDTFRAIVQEESGVPSDPGYVSPGALERLGF